MKISQVTVRANREWAPFQHARIEIIAKFDRSSEDKDEIIDAVTEYAHTMLTKTCERLAQNGKPNEQKKEEPY